MNCKAAESKMFLENTEIQLFMHMDIFAYANYAGSTNYYIYRQIFKGASLEVKEQAQDSYRRDDTSTCCGPYQVLHEEHSFL